jgi:acyl carrier protein
MHEIQRILREQLEATRTYTLTDRLADCAELDSVGLLTVAVGLEDRFRVKLAEQDAPGLETFADLVRLVVRRQQESKP